MATFSIREIKPTGKWKSFSESEYQVKLDKQIVGELVYKKSFKVRLMVIKKDINEDGNPNCIWRWAILKTSELKTKEEVKSWLNENATAIIAHFNLHKTTE